MSQSINKLGLVANVLISTTEPASPVPNMFWLDVSDSSSPILKIRNGDNTAWVIFSPDNSTPTIKRASPWLGTPTTSRAANTVYQNLTGKTIIVYLYCTMGAGASYESSYAVMYMDSSNPPSTLALTGFSNITSISFDCGMTIIVPNGWYYELATGGSVTIDRWTEQTL